MALPASTMCRRNFESDVPALQHLTHVGLGFHLLGIESPSGGAPFWPSFAQIKRPAVSAFHMAYLSQRIEIIGAFGAKMVDLRGCQIHSK